MYFLVDAQQITTVAEQDRRVMHYVTFPLFRGPIDQVHMILPAQIGHVLYRGTIG